MLRLIFIMILAIGIWNAGFAQVIVGDTVTDFTVIDVHGKEHHLYNYIDEGKYVCIDFFGVSCNQCLSLVPTFNDTYTNYGCNTGDLVFLAINYFNHDDEVLDFEEMYGGIYPAISGMGGGHAVYEDLEIQFWPQLWLISPNKTLVSKISPITSENIDSVFTSHGITKDSCEISNIQSNNIIDKSINLYPNPATDQITVTYNNSNSKSNTYTIRCMLGNRVMSGNVVYNTTLNISTLKIGMYVFELNYGLSICSQKIFVKL